MPKKESLVDKDLKRIIYCEHVVTQLEVLNKTLLNELATCKDSCVSREEARKYGLEFAGLISSVLSKWEGLKFNKMKKPFENNSI